MASTLSKRRGSGEVSNVGVPDKRLKFSGSNYDDFKPGALIKIRLENFVTYTLAEFDLSPSLNMIMGPNGSGKSTFVCAVCLGLASKPEFVGRSKRITDYIKNGEESGLIEITLRNSGKLEGISHVNPDDKVIKITRRLSRQKTRNEYWINDQEAAESMVKSLVLGLNIQLDNLCQFLSQERVASFAGLKSEKLLVETLRAIDSRLCNILARLKAYQMAETQSQMEINSKRKRLEELAKKRDELKGTVEQLRTYQEKKKEIDLHRKLIPYVRIKAIAAERRNRRAELNRAVKRLKEFLKEKAPLIALDAEVRERVVTAANELTVTRKLFSDLQKECMDKAQRLSEVRKLIETKKQKAEGFQTKMQRVQGEIEAKTQELEQERTSLNAVRPPDSSQFSELEARQNDLIGHESEIKRAVRDIESKITNKTYEKRELEGRVRTAESSMSQNDRIGVLDHLASNDKSGGSIFRTVKEAVKYVRSQEEMRGYVLEPPAITVSVNDPRYAAYLAQCVDFNTRIAFTLVGSEAYDKFGNDLLNNYRVNTRELGTGESKPPLPRDQIRQLGFDFYLSDIVTGDSEVIKMLCQNCNIHSIPIALRELHPQQITKLMQPRSNGRLLFTKFIHGNRVVDMGIGAYSRQVWTKDYECMHKTDFFRISVMSDEEKSGIELNIRRFKSKIRELADSIEKLETQKLELRNARSADAKEREGIVTGLNQLNNLRTRWSRINAAVQSLKGEIANLKNEMKKDVPSLIKHAEDEISSAKKSQTKVMKDLAATVGRLKKCQNDLLFAEVRNFEAKNLDASVNDVVDSVNRREAELNSECSEKKRLYEEAKNVDVQELKDIIESYSREVQEQLHSYVETYDNEGRFNLKDVEETIDRLESELATLNNDESAISILDQVQKEVKDLNESIPRIASSLKETQEAIQKDLSKFEPKIDEIVNNISNKFSDLFQQIGSRGHVALIKPNSYSEWRIEIKVAFRDSAELTRLDAQKQSGGERAVSTVLYMIALQPFTTAPFRVVDEINQGMDARNERIVHKFMVTNACAGNTSQYFLITPKLLTDLYYDERMMIHCVMAGPWLPNPSERPEMVSFGKTSKYIL